jgi:hypothetical protein
LCASWSSWSSNSTERIIETKHQCLKKEIQLWPKGSPSSIAMFICKAWLSNEIIEAADGSSPKLCGESLDHLLDKFKNNFISKNKK